MKPKLHICPLTSILTRQHAAHRTRYRTGNSRHSPRNEPCRRYQTASTTPPGLKGTPRTGNAPDMPKQQFRMTFKNWGEQFRVGDIVHMYHMTGWNGAVTLQPYGDRFREIRRAPHGVMASKSSIESLYPIVDEETRKFDKGVG
ncbi:hypothetical protein JAAARDRAFT_410637 [Jaapia argillacea MUCL 33604]|uniref:Uncharacterized protein n=1 Tax=Jaapia argillacea MUCL 33604 TaxID=933084 RepID=A0A067PS00_9AGAM|nr:hypothetical protein JAAARDRAFT_410637 [Jaapia argillacea MUCL 33604]